MNKYEKAVKLHLEFVGLYRAEEAEALTQATEGATPEAKTALSEMEDQTETIVRLTKALDSIADTGCSGEGKGNEQFPDADCHRCPACIAIHALAGKE